jgi:hypothetical protein
VAVYTQSVEPRRSRSGYEAYRSHFHFEAPCHGFSFFIVLPQDHTKIAVQHDRQHPPVMDEHALKYA